MKKTITIFKNIYRKIIDLKYNKFSRMNLSRDSFVINFHNVLSPTDNKNERYQVSVSEFIDTLNYIKQRGYKFTSIEYLLEHYNEMCCSITFDDGYENVIHFAYPIMLKNNIEFCLFLVNDYIGMQGYLSKNQIKQMMDSGLCTVGSHTLSHNYLAKSNDVKYQLCQSKKLLESLFGTSIQYFAYPYGTPLSYNKHVIKTVEQCGYIYAFSTIKATLNDYSVKNRYTLPRIDSEYFIKQYIKGGN